MTSSIKAPSEGIKPDNSNGSQNFRREGAVDDRKPDDEAPNSRKSDSEKSGSSSLHEEPGEAEAFGAKSLIVDFDFTDSGEPPTMFQSVFGVHEVIDWSNPSKLMREAKARRGSPETEPRFRWIHLPANNMLWVEVSTLSCPFTCL